MTTNRIEIFDGTIPLLDKIGELAPNVALESLSIAGDIMRKNARNEMKRSRTNWYKSYEDGKRKIWRDTSATKELGTRLASSPDSMSNFITSYIGAASMTVVIGGRHPRSKQFKRRNGEIVGSYNLQAVSKSSHAILHKLNFGEQNDYYKRSVRPNSIKGFENAKYKDQQFMQKAYFSSRARIEDVMTIRLARILEQSISRVNVKLRKVV